jgi:hypothetical protein
MGASQIGTYPPEAFKWLKRLRSGPKIDQFGRYMFHHWSERKKQQHRSSPLTEFQSLLIHD